MSQKHRRDYVTSPKCRRSYLMSPKRHRDYVTSPNDVIKARSFEIETFASLQFKARPSKAVTIKGWMLLHSDDPTRLDLFQLTNPNLGNTYRFQCESGDVALVWLNYLKTAVKENTKNAREVSCSAAKRCLQKLNAPTTVVKFCRRLWREFRFLFVK